MFLKIPQWIAKLFPTYFVLNPIIEQTMNNSSQANIAADVYILIGLTSALIGGRFPCPPRNGCRCLSLTGTSNAGQPP